MSMLQDQRLRWPDTFSQEPDGMMFVTSSHIMDMNWFEPDSPITLKTTLLEDLD